MIDDSQLVATLLEEGLADQATVDEGLQRTEQSGVSLYETLIHAQLVAEPQLVEVASRLLDVPAQEVDVSSITADVSALVPASMARRNRVLPLAHNDDGSLLLGMANPADNLAVDEIAMHAGVTIRPVLVGPGALSEALQLLYPTADVSQEVADAVLDAFDDDDFEIPDLMDEVMPGDEWSDYFNDKSEASIEDSAVLSRDMQDRPSTDVLAEEDVDAAVEEVDEEDLPEIEIIEELGQPIRRRPPSPYASLDEWEVDDAIAGASEIINARSAGELFAPGEGDAAIEEEDEEDDEIDATSQLADISESHTDALETSNKTSVGVGVDHLKSKDADNAGRALPKKKKRVTVESTGKTELGLPKNDDASSDVLTEARAAEEVDDDEFEEYEDDEDYENTDYGALGRAILKSGPSGKKRRRRRRTRPKGTQDEGTPDDATDIADADDERRPTDPRPLKDVPAEEISGDEDEKKSNTNIVVALFEDDDEFPEHLSPPSTPTHARSLVGRSDAQLSEANVSEAQLSEAHVSEAADAAPPSSEPQVTAEPDEPAPADDQVVEALDVDPDEGTRPRLLSPALNLPDDVDAHGLALALANILVRKEICTIDEIFELAKFLSKNQ